MDFNHSHQLAEILRGTLRKLENDPATVSSDEDVAQLRRILVRWIAEAETAQSRISAPPAEPAGPLVIADPVSATPKKRALDLAVALISDSPAEPSSEAAEPPQRVKDPTAA